MDTPGSDPKKLLHRVLMRPVALERVPSWLILGLLIGLAAGVDATWSGTLPAGPAAAAWLLFALLDWALLAGLPRTERSFGPVKPPLLALAVLRSIVAALLAVAGKPWLALSAMAAITTLAWYGTWIEPLDIRVTKRTLALQRWPAGAPPLRLLHLSDLHLERAGRREEKLVKLIDSLAPDLICFSGDLLNLSYNADPLAIANARAVIGRWRAPLGVYAVTGSPLVDLPWAAEEILKNLPKLRWLRDEAITFDAAGRPLTLVGLNCTHQPAVDGPKLRAALADTPPDSPVILIYHTPDLAPEAAAAGVDLQLSGHTHGGQIRLPFYGALLTSSIYRKRFEMGEYHLPRNGRDPMTLYVSRGIGTEGGAAPRARFLCRPEITLWTLTSDPTTTLPQTPETHDRSAS
jgi:predicted MPP superfamily phosphohydrolase